MQNFRKDNHCLLCPKAFCCSSCRCKHENSVHKSQIICYLCANISKPYPCNKYKQVKTNSKHVLCAKAIAKMSDTSEEKCSPKTPHANGNVQQLIMKFSTESTSHNFSNEKEKKSVSFKKYQTSKQFSMEILAASTPMPTLTEKEANHSYGSLQDAKEMKIEENNSDINSTIDVSKPTEYPNSNNFATKEERSEESHQVAISMESEPLGATDNLMSNSNIFPSTSIRSNYLTFEEQDNILNEDTDVTEAVDVEVFESAHSKPEDGNSVNLDSTGTGLHRSSSIASLSQVVWHTITNSIKSALYTTEDTNVSNITDEVSERYPEIFDDEPSAKRRKYEPYLKCRRPIHDLDIIVFTKYNGRTSVCMSKATQTEDCYFT